MKALPLALSLTACLNVHTRIETIERVTTETWSQTRIPVEPTPVFDRLMLHTTDGPREHPGASLVRLGDLVRVIGRAGVVTELPVTEVLQAQGERRDVDERVTRAGAGDEVAWTLAGMGIALSTLALLAAAASD